MKLSEKQLAANRLNAQKSTGPRTQRGKQISSQNAVTHGLFAKAVLIPGESEPNFNSLHRAYIKDFNPTTQEERDLVETLAACRWRIRRDWTMEAASLALEQQAQAHETAGEDPAIKAVRAQRALCQPPRSQESLSRHEGRCNRAYNQALDRLHRIRHEKNAETNPQPQQNQQPYPIQKPIRTIDEPSANPQRSPIEPEKAA